LMGFVNFASGVGILDLQAVSLLVDILLVQILDDDT
jgi:hypothetical protein